MSFGLLSNAQWQCLTRFLLFLLSSTSWAFLTEESQLQFWCFFFSFPVYNKKRDRWPIDQKSCLIFVRFFHAALIQDLWNLCVRPFMGLRIPKNRFPLCCCPSEIPDSFQSLPIFSKEMAASDKSQRKKESRFSFFAKQNKKKSSQETMDPSCQHGMVTDLFFFRGIDGQSCNKSSLPCGGNWRKKKEFSSCCRTAH